MNEQIALTSQHPPPSGDYVRVRMLVEASACYPSLVDTWHQWWCIAYAKMSASLTFPKPFLESHLGALEHEHAPSVFIPKLVDLPAGLLERVDHVCLHHAPGAEVTEWALGEAIARYVLADARSTPEREQSWHLISRMHLARRGFREAFSRYFSPAHGSALIGWAQYSATHFDDEALGPQKEHVRQVLRAWEAQTILAEVWDERRFRHFSLATVHFDWIPAVLSVDRALFLDCLEALANPFAISIVLNDDNVHQDEQKLLWLMEHAGCVSALGSQGTQTWNRRLVAPFLLSSAVHRVADVCAKSEHDANNPSAATGMEGRLINDEAGAQIARLADRVLGREDGVFLLANYAVHVATEFSYQPTAQLNAYATYRLLTLGAVVDSMASRQPTWDAWVSSFGVAGANSDNLASVSNLLGQRLVESIYTAWAFLQERTATPLAVVDSGLFALLKPMHFDAHHMPNATWRDWRLAFAIARARDPAQFWKTHWQELEHQRAVARYGRGADESYSHRSSLYWVWVSFSLLNLSSSGLRPEPYFALLQETWRSAWSGYLEFESAFGDKLDGSRWGYAIVNLVIVSLYFEVTGQLNEERLESDFTVEQVRLLGGDVALHVHVLAGAQKAGMSPQFLISKWTAADQSLRDILPEYLESAQKEHHDNAPSELVLMCRRLLNEVGAPEAS